MEELEPFGPTKNLVVIQRNRRAGTARKQRQIHRLIRELKRLGFRPRLFSSRERLDHWMSQEGHGDSVVCLVGAGGDGTLQDLLNRHPTMTMAQLPIGTENVLSCYLGVPHDGCEIARMIAAGNVKQMDLGCREKQTFVLMASVGFDAEVIHRAHAARSGHTSRWRYLWPIAVALWNRPGPALKVTIDDHQPRLAQMAVVVNVPRYALGLNMARHAADDDGFLEVRLFRKGSAWDMWRYFFHLCLGGHESLKDVDSIRASRIHIDSEIPQPVQIDGDPAGMTPVTLSVIPGGMKILIPGTS